MGQGNKNKKTARATPQAPARRYLCSIYSSESTMMSTSDNGAYLRAQDGAVMKVNPRDPEVASVAQAMIRVVFPFLNEARPDIIGGCPLFNPFGQEEEGVPAAMLSVDQAVYERMLATHNLSTGPVIKVVGETDGSTVTYTISSGNSRVVVQHS